jgi:hypothetical protein
MPQNLDCEMKVDMRHISRSFMLTLLLAVLITAGISLLYSAYAAENNKAAFKEDYVSAGDSLHVEYSAPSGSSVSYKWYIDDKKISCTGDTYCVTTDDMEKEIRAEVWEDGKKVSECSMISSVLPVIYINTEGGQSITSKEEYLSAEMNIQGCEKYNNDNTDLYNGEIGIKGRGNSTWKRFEKKPYKIKLDKKTNLFGLGKNKHWVLLANYIDESGMRNMLASYYGKNLGTTAMDGLWVNVVLNDKFIGMYQLSEHIRIDKNRVDIYDWEGAAGDIAEAFAEKNDLSKDEEDALGTYLEENLSWITTDKFEYNGKNYTASDYYTKPDSVNGGCLFEIDTNGGETPSYYTDRNVPMNFDTPEFAASSSTFSSMMKNYVQKMEDAFYSTDQCVKDIGGSRLSYVDICDADSLVSFWMASEFMRNEIGAKSTFFYKDIDQPIYFGPIWDFDWSSDSVAPFGATSTRSWATKSRPWFSGVMKNPYFAVKARELFREKEDMLRESVESGGIIDQWHDYISKPALKNETIWKYSRGFEEDTVALKSWIQNRITWMDEQFATDQSTMNSLGVSLSDKFSITLSGDDIEHISDNAYETETSASKTIYADINIPNNTYGSLNYYINGRYIGNIKLDGENVVPIDLDSSLFTEEQGEKNVISVWLKTTDGQFVEQQYCTLKFTQADTEYCDVVLNEHGSSRVIKVASGDKFRLPKVAVDSSMLFTGWRKEGSEEDLQPGDKITVDSSIELTAHFAECSDGDVQHNWEASGDDYICKKCGKTKADDREYVDIADCKFDQSSRYRTRYTGSPVAPVITVSYAGRVLTEGKDYYLSIRNNVNVGYATYKITGIHSAGFDGSAEQSYRIIAGKIKSATCKLSKTSYKYDGKAKSPKVSLSYKGIDLAKNKDYTVSYSNNKKVGTATVLIKGIGNFTGVKKVSFKIYKVAKPKKTSLRKLTAKKGRKVIVIWKKQTKDAEGYQIRYAANEKFKSAKSVKIKGSKKTTKTIKVKKSGKKYYFEIRTYKKVNKKTYYSSWSKVKTVRTKK